jgi:hypothetical protein
LEATVDRHQPPPHRNKANALPRHRLRRDRRDGAGTFFHAEVRTWLQNALPVGAYRMLVSGQARTLQRHAPQMVHPDRMVPAD